MSNSVRRVSELPQPFRDAFSSFQLFNAVQSDCFHECFHTDVNMVIAAPTGSGKTVTLELCMLRLLSRHLDHDGQWCPSKGLFKVVYVAPTKALIQERVNDWSKRYGHLKMSIMECTGDSAEALDLTQADVIATTPEKLDALSRRCFDTGSMRFVSDVALLLIDEVHSVSDSRGPTLEAGVVCRLQALGCMPQMHGSNLRNLRIVAASATIPNVYDIAQWIKAPNEGCKVFGEEMRPVTIKTVVKAFPAGKNDFLFERNLNDKVFPILQEHWQQKPVIIFCSSRKGTVECCNKILEASKRLRVHTPAFFVKNAAHQARLREAAEAVQDKPLSDFIVQGLAWHHAAMSHEDRTLVEQLFISRDIMCIAATATLAQGVNLPAFLVIIKGTQRYCSDAGKGPSSYQEYDQGECLQMIGRAGRPQFESSAIAVVMTKSEHRIRYQNLATGRKSVESELHRCSTEFLNADIAQGIVTSVSQAHAWLQKSLFWVRVFQNPTQYGLTEMGITPDRIAQQAMHLFVDAPLKRLKHSGLIEVNDVDGSVTPKDPALMMCKHCMQLATMVMINSVPNAASPRDLLEIVCKASENADIMLRRTEKKVLNALNQSAAEQERDVPGSSYMVREAADSTKRKQRLSEPWEKSFVLVNACLAAGGVNSPLIDYSMINDASRVMQNGLRIATCMIRYYAFQRRFAAMTAAIRLHRAMLQKMWDGYQSTCRQVPGVGSVLVQRLAAAGIRSITDFAKADPRQLELVTTRLYPWGDTKREDARRLLPPPCSLDVELVGFKDERHAGGDRVPKVKVTVHCTAPGRNKAFCWLVVGCLNDDSLMLSRYMDIASVAEPMELTAMLRSNVSTDLRIVAAILSEKVIGGDIVTPVSYTSSQLSALQARTGKTKPTVASKDACLPEGVHVVAHQDNMHQGPPDTSAVLATTKSAPLSTVHVLPDAAPPLLVSGNPIAADPTLPAVRPRAAWVSQLSKDLDVPNAKPPHEAPEKMQPHGVCQNLAAPQQLQTLAERVEHVKHSSTMQCPPPQDFQKATASQSQQAFETSWPTEPMSCSGTNTYAGVSALAAPASHASHPSTGEWHLTTLHDPEVGFDTRPAAFSRMTSYGHTGASSPLCASIQQPAAQESALCVNTAGTMHPGPSCINETLHCKHAESCAGSTTHAVKLCPDIIVHSKGDLSSDAPTLLPQAATPAMSQQPKSGQAINVQESSAILSCSSHVQPSPDSPKQKPDGVDFVCQNPPAAADPDKDGPCPPDANKQSPLLGRQCTITGTAVIPELGGAAQKSRRAALKHLIRRARNILSSNLEQCAHFGHPGTPADVKQHVDTLRIDAQHSRAPLAPMPAFEGAACEAKRAATHVTGVHVKACDKENDFVSSGSIDKAACLSPERKRQINSNQCDVMTAVQEPECSPNPTPEPNLGSSQPSRIFTETILRCTANDPSLESASATVQKTASNTPKLPVGIWERFKSQGQPHVISDTPTANEEGCQVQTEPGAQHGMWSTADGPQPLLMATAASTTSDSSIVNTPSTVTKTRSLVQRLLIGQQDRDTEATQQERIEPASPQRVENSALMQGRQHKDEENSKQPLITALQDSAMNPSQAHDNKGYVSAFNEQDIVLSPDPPYLSLSGGKALIVPSGATQNAALQSLHSLDVATDRASLSKEDEQTPVLLHKACKPCATSTARTGPETAAGPIHLDPKPCQEAEPSQRAQEPMSYQFSQHAIPATKVSVMQLQDPMLTEEPKAVQNGASSCTDEENGPLSSALQMVQKGQQKGTDQTTGRNNVGATDADVSLSPQNAQHCEEQKQSAAAVAHPGLSSTSPECVAAAQPEHAGTGMHGTLHSSKKLEQVLKFPRLPKPYTGLSNRGAVDTTDGARNVTGVNGLGSRKGNAVGVKRRLGGAASVTQTRPEPVNDNKGLKRAFKVPRSK